MFPLYRAAALVSAACLVICSASVNALAQQPPATRDSTSRDSLRRTVLRPVTIVATPAARVEPIDATHIDASTIEITPANSPYDMLRQTAGLEVHQQGQGPGFASDASLRGFSSDHSTDLALWIDGVPINEPINGHAEGYNDFSVLFPGGVRDIDVVRGPTSALFGNFALAGVVNVRTLERMRGTQFTAQGGSFGSGDAMLLTGFDHGARGGGVLGARYQHEDGFRPNAGFDLGQGHARIVHDIAPGWTIDAGSELYGTQWRSAGFLSEDEFTAHDYRVVSNPTDGGFKQRGQERVSLRFISSSLLWRTTAYATQGRWQLFLTIPPAGGRFEGSGSQTEEEDRRYGYGLTSALTWEGERGEITFGTEERWDHTNYENYFTTARTRDSTNALVTARQLSGALFVQSHYDVGDRLRFDIGARYDELGTRSLDDDSQSASSANHGVLSPKAGALYHLMSGVGVYANASRGFRSTDGVISNPTLAPIVAWNYETGVKVDREINGLPLSATATLFRMNVSNEQTFNPLTGQANNGGASRREGLEIETHLPVFSAASIDADWTFLDARYQHLIAVSEDATKPPATLDGLRVYNTAQYVGTAALQIAPPRTWWSLRLAGNWVGPYSPFDEPGVVLGAYGLAHLSGTAQWRSIRLELGVRNLFDRAYPELVAGHIVDPGQPRAVFTTLKTVF